MGLAGAWACDATGPLAGFTASEVAGRAARLPAATRLAAAGFVTPRLSDTGVVAVSARRPAEPFLLAGVVAVGVAAPRPGSDWRPPALAAVHGRERGGDAAGDGALAGLGTRRMLSMDSGSRRPAARGADFRARGRKPAAEPGATAPAKRSSPWATSRPFFVAGSEESGLPDGLLASAAKAADSTEWQEPPRRTAREDFHAGSSLEAERARPRAGLAAAPVARAARLAENEVPEKLSSCVGAALAKRAGLVDRPRTAATALSDFLAALAWAFARAFASALAALSDALASLLAAFSAKTSAFVFLGAADLDLDLPAAPSSSSARAAGEGLRASRGALRGGSTGASSMATTPTAVGSAEPRVFS